MISSTMAKGLVAFALLTCQCHAFGWTGPKSILSSRRGSALMSAALGPESKPLSIEQPLSFKIADAVVGGLFAIDPLFNVISNNARTTMKNRAESMGVSWNGLVDNYKRHMDEIQQDYEDVFREKVVTPDYYQKPFHAYKEGNLCWDAALEVDVAALTVHSNIYTPEKDILEKDGDYKLREYFHSEMLGMLLKQQFKPHRIVDIGCSTGLSTMKLQSTFPEAEVLGIDLSPHMLSVAKYNLRNRVDLRNAKNRVDYVHAAGEDTGLPDASVDMVSICLVNHELPSEAARKVFKEAHRILEPGGALTFMDMNPQSPSFQRIIDNPMLFALFKSTEPWLQEYVTLDLMNELKAAGFSKVDIGYNSPRHRTVVAFK